MDDIDDIYSLYTHERSDTGKVTVEENYYLGNPVPYSGSEFTYNVNGKMV